MIKQKFKVLIKYFKLGTYLRSNEFGFEQALDEALAIVKKKTYKIPIVSLEEITPGPISLKISEKETKDGNVSLSELLCIVSIIKYYQARKIFELGTFDGRTTLNMHHNCCKKPNIFTLDLPKSHTEKTVYKIHDWEKIYTNKNEPGIKFSHLKDEGSIIQILSDSANFERQDLNDYFDFIFVDGSHTNKYVENDTELAMRLINKEKGIIVWHDYNSGWQDVTNTMENYFAKDKRFKNIKSIKETSLLYLNNYHSPKD